MQATVAFSKLVLNSQELGSDDEHMVSRIYFSLTVDGKTHPDLSADIKQTVGSAYESAPLEVSKPCGYHGPFNHDAFQKAAEKCYRGFFGSTGRLVRMTGASIRNAQVDVVESATFEVDPSNRAW